MGASISLPNSLNLGLGSSASQQVQLSAMTEKVVRVNASRAVIVRS